MSMKAVLYARVSTDDQADKGYSIPSQLEAERQYAAREGMEVVAEFQDDYSGATPIEFRPEGQKAYAMLKSGAADAIIAYTIDRFVRPPEDGDEWEMPILIRGLAKLGKEIHTCDIGKLKTDFVSLLLVVIGAKSAGEERRKIMERSMRGKREKAKAGRVVGGRGPYGYRHVRDSRGLIFGLQIEPDEARIVQQVYAWYVDGDEEGKLLSAHAIARQLSEMHVPTPGNGQGGFNHPSGRTKWHPTAVVEILSNERYAGVWWYGARMSNRYQRRPREEQIPVAIPPIIARELWQAAQARREMMRRARNPRHTSLLRELIHCGCSAPMRGDSGNPRRHHRYYVCIRARRHQMTDGAPPCRERMVRADALEADVWDEVAELFSDLSRMAKELSQAQNLSTARLEPVRARLAITDGLVRAVEAEADKLVRARREPEATPAERAELERGEQAANARLDALYEQRGQLVRELGSGAVIPAEEQALAEFTRDARSGIEHADEATRRRMLKALRVAVTVAERRYTIRCVIGEAQGVVRDPRGTTAY